ncbi:MAG: relaxase/mobilization nuclease domain-containing protein [Oribacterium sp.]|nr:relaxase/mobilization nuclease domain-containing protein [Oribacterium sp.]
MPVVKPKSVHETPERLIKYILDPDKNEKMKFAKGIRCHPDAATAYDEFKEIYSRFSTKEFHKKARSDEQKDDILLFHYIQSFKPGECTAELAHKIGVEWARRVFGDDRPVLISTHDDKLHVHNHFAVSVYDINGKRWYENKTSLRRCREISDKLAIEYGLSVIDKPEYHSNQRYGDWLHRKTGTSWKVKLANDIDRLIMDSSVNSVDDLVDKLKAKGYEVRRRKYISIRAPRGKHFIRSLRLGDGYSLEALMYRIINRDTVMSPAAVSKYEGIQYKYALCLREIQMMLYRKKENTLRATYNDLLRSSELLCFLVNNHISDDEQFKEFVSAADEKFRESEGKQADIVRRCGFEEKLIADSKRFLELWRNDERTPEETEELENYRVLIDYGVYKPGEVDRHRGKLKKLREELAEVTSETEELKAERKTAADNYRYYLEQMQGDLGMIFKRKRAEQEERQKDHRDIEEIDRTQEEPQEYRDSLRRSTEAR